MGVRTSSHTEQEKEKKKKRERKQRNEILLRSCALCMCFKYAKVNIWTLNNSQRHGFNVASSCFVFHSFPHSLSLLLLSLFLLFLFEHIFFSLRRLKAYTCELKQSDKTTWTHLTINRRMLETDLLSASENHFINGQINLNATRRWL